MMNSGKRVMMAFSTLLLWNAGALAASLASFSNSDMTSALKQALTSSSLAAVSSLGRPGGFLNNPQVRIPLPPALQKAQIAMRAFGLGQQADQLDIAMNHAAEQAVPQAKELLLQAVDHMTVRDAEGILTGGNRAATAYFKRTTEAGLTAKFEPIVARTVDRIGLAQEYNEFAGKAAAMHLISGQEASVSAYVTQKALDGLYTIMGNEEAAIRQNPARAGSQLVATIFGSLK
jgi:hypothetical protein